MKKLLSIILCLAMICGIFAGCSGLVEKTNAYTPGKAEGDVFSSEWIGIQYTKTDDMVFATEEELNEMLDISADAISEDKDGKKLIDYAKASSVIEMMASSIYGDNVLLMTEKLPLQSFTVDQYIESFQKQMDGQGMTFDGQTKATIAGKEFVQLDYSIDVGGIYLYQSYYLYKVESRMVAIIVTYFEEATREDILSGFKAIETK